MRRLAAAGITTSGAGGNAVRNVVACPFAGVSASEPFDVTPYAEAVTRHFLRHPLASSLPRKFKVAFEGCSDDHVATHIQDLGFRARVRMTPEGRLERGFALTVAGGTSTPCTSGSKLFEFLPTDDLLALAEAIVRFFHARGDRENKHRNRLKFLVRDLGFEAFRTLVEELLENVKREGSLTLRFDVDAAGEQLPPRTRHPAPPSPAEVAARVEASPPRGPGVPPAVVPELAPTAEAFETFLATNVRPQRHAAAGLGRAGAGSAGDVVACPGSELCRLAVTRTRDVARLVEQRLRSSIGTPALRAPLPVHISGCPNGCSQHHLAAIGLQGSARKLGARAVPQYFVVLGGGVDERGATFGKVAAKVPARRVPEAIERLAALWIAERVEGETAGAFFARSLDRARAATADLEYLTLDDARAEDFVEPGATDDFHPATQEGECAA